MTDQKIKLLRLNIHTATQNVLHIYCEETREQVESKARRAMTRGASIEWGDGTEQWIQNDPIIKDGQVVFHDDGNRIRTEVTEYTLKPGQRTERVLRTVWMDYLKVFED